jgi:hypothetical protein
MIRKLVIVSALGASVLAIVLLLQSQSSPVQQYNPSHWPPRPDEIVDVHTANLGSLPTIHPAASLALFQVPTDRSFVLTSATGGNASLQLCEDLGGTRTIKLTAISTWPPGNGPVAEGPLGIVFRPGSNVVAFNTSATDQLLSPVDLYGYLAR